MAGRAGTTPGRIATTAALRQSRIQGLDEEQQKAQACSCGSCRGAVQAAEVAAKVRETWIHARIIRFRRNRVQVEDADTETGSEKTDRYHVPTNVIPLVLPKKVRR